MFLYTVDIHQLYSNGNIFYQTNFYINVIVALRACLDSI